VEVIGARVASLCDAERLFDADDVRCRGAAAISDVQVCSSMMHCDAL